VHFSIAIIASGVISDEKYTGLTRDADLVGWGVGRGFI
jgi:hypothetical protein